MKRKYSGSYASNKIAKVSTKPKRYYKAGLINRVFNQVPNQIFNQFASKGYRSGEEVRCCDFRFTGGYNAGLYTADTEPFQKLSCNTTGCIQSLSNFQQGVGLANRSGNKASLKSIRLRLNIVPTGNFFLTSRARIILFYDRQPNGNYLNPTDLLTQITSNNALVAGIDTDGINANYMDRIRVLRDEWFTLPALANGAVQDLIGPTVMDAYQIDWFLKLKDLELVFKATSNPGVIANSAVGSLQILVMGDVSANSEPWQFAGSARVRFRNN